MIGLVVLVQVGLLVVLPQLAGLLVTRFVRRTSWTAWPAAAIAVFGVVFYWWLWVPARDAAAQMTRTAGCGRSRSASCSVIGLLGHLGVGVLFGLLAAPPA